MENKPAKSNGRKRKGLLRNHRRQVIQQIKKLKLKLRLLDQFDRIARRLAKLK